MKEVKVAAVSDLHGNLSVRIPECDLLTISGDICPVTGGHSVLAQEDWLHREFVPWMRSLLDSGAVKRIALTPGNHDFVFFKHPCRVLFMETPDIKILVDREAEVCGLRIYGTPWTPTFGNWAFMDKDSVLKNKFSEIPEGLDILLTHGPMYGYGDVVEHPIWTRDDGDPHLGSRSLSEAVVRAAPRYHLFGHIHTGSHTPTGVMPTGLTVSANVSVLDERYELKYPAFEFSVFKEDGE